MINASDARLATLNNLGYSSYQDVLADLENEIEKEIKAKKFSAYMVFPLGFENTNLFILAHKELVKRGFKVGLTPTLTKTGISVKITW